MSNLVAWSLQAGALVALAAFVPALFGIRMPGVRLAYWQTLLAACLVLPFVRPWKQALAEGGVTVMSTVTAVRSAPAGFHWNISWTDGVLLLVLAGTAARLVWLASGFLKLRAMRLGSLPFESERTAQADVRISTEVASPVTFGFLRPVILLPAGFPELAPEAREAILCHERLHVKRRDWLFTLAEEFIRAVLWFHPAIWWVLGEIQLAREQVVDAAVIERTRARDPYVDALLEIAGAGQCDLAPASLFLRRRHLKQRVSLILKEVRMSKRRSYSALAAGVALMAGLCWFVSGAFPLIAQTPVDDPGVSVSSGDAQLIHRAPVKYPREVLGPRVEGTVTVQAQLSPTGAVREVAAISGPAELQDAVVRSVRAWHYTRDAAPVQQITVVFRVPSDGPLTVKNVSIEGLTDSAAAQLRAQLPVHAGDVLSNELLQKTRQAAAAYDEHLSVASTRASDTETTIVISPASGRIRIGGNVQQANLLSQAIPVYPPDAKAARVQGVVRFEVDISPEGKVEDMRLVSGPALLVQSALSAVSKWVYKPTLLNGNPVAVTTTVDVNYTLSN